MTQPKGTSDLIDRINSQVDTSSASIPTHGDPAGEHELSPEIIAAAHADPPDHARLSQTLANAGLGGAIVGDLFTRAIGLEKSLAPLAADHEAATKRVAEVDSQLSALKRFRPTSIAETEEQRLAIAAAEKKWTQGLTYRSQCEHAAHALGWLFSYLPGLFDRKPRESGVFGYPPAGIDEWFKTNRVDFRECDSWRFVGRQPERRPRRRLVTRK